MFVGWLVIIAGVSVRTGFMPSMIAAS